MKQIVQKYKRLFSRGYYPKTMSKNIYGSYFYIGAVAMQLAIAVFACVSLKMWQNIYAFYVAVTLIYCNTFFCVYYEYKRKENMSKEIDWEFGSYSDYYLNKVKQAFILGLGMTIGTILFFARQSFKLNLETWQEFYWIWFAILMFMGISVRLIDVVSIFGEKRFISGRYIVEYDKISDIKIIKKKLTIKGEVYTVEIYEGDRCIGHDRFFAEDYSLLRKRVMLRAFN